MYMLADLMTDPKHKELFLSFAQGGMEGEKDIHDMLIKRFGIDTEVTESKVTSDYNAHICNGIASANPCIALADVLLCMWIYNKVLAMIDDWALKADEETIRQMNRYFLKAALFEYAFWDYGYHGNGQSYDYTDTLEEWL